MPFGRAPVLEVDGTKIAGSINILRYLGAKFGEGIPVCIDNTRIIHIIIYAVRDL